MTQKFYIVQARDFFLDGRSDHVGHWTAWYTIAVTDSRTTAVQPDDTGQERRQFRTRLLKDKNPWGYVPDRDGPRESRGVMRDEDPRCVIR